MSKRILFCAAVLTVGLAVSVAPSVAAPITEVVEAGIEGCGDTPDDFGPQFWKDVDAACKGKTSCKVRLTDSYPLATLQQYGCKSFFVEFICKDEIEKVEAPNLTSEAALQCN
jgi:hypothetical protein